jgi:hypothetical protein
MLEGVTLKVKNLQTHEAAKPTRTKNMENEIAIVVKRFERKRGSEEGLKMLKMSESCFKRAARL